jgi:hypothetical protein
MSAFLFNFIPYLLNRKHGSCSVHQPWNFIFVKHSHHHLSTCKTHGPKSRPLVFSRFGLPVIATFILFLLPDLSEQ